MSRRFRICMGKWEGCWRPSYMRPKLTIISKFVAMQIPCYEKLILFYFWFDCFETNKRWAPIQELHVPFVSKRSDKKKNNSGNFSWRPWFFVILPFFCSYYFETEARSTKPTIFSESWVLQDSLGGSPEKFPVEKFWVRSVLPKKNTFLQIYMSRL